MTHEVKCEHKITLPQSTVDYLSVKSLVLVEWTVKCLCRKCGQVVWHTVRTKEKVKQI